MRVLMVCTGNICRSTMAHQVLDEAVAAGGLSGAVRVDSAGVSDEEHGNPIDPRAARVLRAHGHGVPDHRARQVRADELADWDLVLAMTSSHYAALSRLRDRARPGGRAPEIRMFRDFDPQCAHLPEGPGRDKDLPDPWYGDYGDFVDTLAVIERSTPVMCPGYCGECLRPDWRFGMSGQRKYSMELRERATRMALEARADPERRRGAIKRIGGQLGINPEALRTWVRAVEQGGRNERGEVSDQEARIRALEAENRELRRANEILKAASAFFGAELDRLGR